MRVPECRCRVSAAPAIIATHHTPESVNPSFPMIGTITSPAAGSAHHHPAIAFRSNPLNRMADKYVQKSVCRESACMAPLPIPTATRRLALTATASRSPRRRRRAVCRHRVSQSGMLPNWKMFAVHLRVIPSDVLVTAWAVSIEMP